MTKKRKKRPSVPGNTEVIGINETAQLLGISSKLVYRLFARGELPAKKLGRKWFSTRSAILKHIGSNNDSNNNHNENDSLVREIESGNREALVKALKSGAVRVKAGK